MCVCRFLFGGGLVFMSVFSVMAADVYQKEDPPAMQSDFDRFLNMHWRKNKITPANEASDCVLVRRLYIDLLGRVPTPEETLAFINSQETGKYSALIDKLISSEEHAMFWTMRLGDELRIKSEFPINLWPNATFLYSRFIWEFLHKNEPYDRFAARLLLASGSNFRRGEANFFRALPVKNKANIAEAAALFFMGKKLSALPGEEQEFYKNSFDGIRYKSTREWKEEIVYSVVNGKDDPRHRFIAHMLKSDDFAETMVRRLWRWLFGHGDIDPEIAACLAGDFRKNGYDVKKLTAGICNSAAYRVGAFCEGDYARSVRAAAVYPVRRLDAEVLADSIAQITGVPNSYSSVIPEPFSYYNGRAAALTDGSVSDSFLILFGRPSRDTGAIDERKNNITAKQRLQLFNSTELYRKTQSALMRKIKPEKDRVSTLYLLFYSRYPTQDERNIICKKLRGKFSTHGALAWILLNSREFLYQH